MSTGPFVSSSPPALRSAKGKSHACFRRQQYIQEAHSTPTFAKLYNVRELSAGRVTVLIARPPQLLISVEKEIEDTLPQFQEHLFGLKFVFYHSMLVLD